MSDKSHHDSNPSIESSEEDLSLGELPQKPLSGPDETQRKFEELFGSTADFNSLCQKIIVGDLPSDTLAIGQQVPTSSLPGDNEVYERSPPTDGGQLGRDVETLHSNMICQRRNQTISETNSLGSSPRRIARQSGVRTENSSIRRHSLDSIGSATSSESKEARKFPRKLHSDDEPLPQHPPPAVQVRDLRPSSAEKKRKKFAFLQGARGGAPRRGPAERAGDSEEDEEAQKKELRAANEALRKRLQSFGGFSLLNRDEPVDGRMK